MAAYTAIDDPEAHFQTAPLWTGNGSTRSITLDGSEDMQPDLVWIYNRGGTYASPVFDAVRTATKFIESISSNAEATVADTLTSFDSDGFSLGADTSSYVNRSSSPNTYVGWCWKANGSGSSNTDGSINTASTSVNTTSGFSISKYVGTGSNATVGHGLGVAPKVVIVKDLDATGGWRSFTETTGNQSQLALDQTSAADSGNTTMWNSTSPTSTVFSIGTHGNVNTNTNNYIAYSFANVQGFSKVGGSYVGNGNADGTFVYTGFKPAFILLKSTGDNDWVLFDTKRPGYNGSSERCRINQANTALTSTGEYAVDHLSNGFKFRGSGGGTNGSGTTFIYLAFAEAPLVNSNGAPCNAR